ncbi:MAG: S46 family peptidase [Bacteroidota bacterium]
MIKKGILTLSIVALCLSFVSWKSIDEGMWLLNKLPLEAMKAKGLQLSAEEIFSPTSPSLKDAVVLLGGGTGSFVSTDGLIMTNHHVAFGAIQALSTVEHDYLKDGFLAKSREEELSAENYTAAINKDIVDITAEVLSAVSDTMSAEQRAKAIDAKSRELENQWKEKTKLDCRVTDMYSGLKYYLFTSERLLDIRLVFAPPSSVGNYGGEVDNWMWPRHTGDFSIFRAYTGPDEKPARYSKQNVPYKPVKYLPVSGQGVQEGSFVMVMGYPGRTFRYRDSYSIALAQEETYPVSVDLFKTRIDIIEKAGKQDRAVAIKMAGKVRGIANTYKNYLGMLDGMKRYKLLKWKQDLEIDFTKWLGASPDLQKKYGDVLPKIGEAYANLRTFNKKQLVTGNILGASDMLRIAARFMSFARSKAKQEPTEGEISTMKKFIRDVYKDAYLPADREILTALLKKAADLPPGQKLAPVEEIVKGKTGAAREKAIEEYVEDLYSDSRVTTVEGCDELVAKKVEKIEDDPFVRLAHELDKENRQIGERVTKFNATITALRTGLMDGWSLWKGGLTYPEANRTLRLTYGTVRKYVPRDAVEYNWMTKLGGVIEKESNEDPFIIPPKLRDMYDKRDFGNYADPKLGDVPVCFLADCDITGGNSGSPVVNGRGEFVGAAFDGNWEAITGDYRFEPSMNRMISVESRYILFILDKFAGAKNIIQELDVRGTQLGRQ